MNAEQSAFVRAIFILELHMDFYVAAKAIGDWELDVLAIPFGSRDSDGQWFDDRTDIMPDVFSTPLAVYQHGVKQGAQELDEKPQIIGRTVPGSLQKMVDGWHVRIILDKALKVAKDIMDAAYKQLVAVSSGSIAHLARLDVGGKLIQYEKNRVGRIAVWPLAEISIWELGNGNLQPASPLAIALPVMKAMYRDAGIAFPDIDTNGVTEADEVKRRAKIRQLQIQSLENLRRIKK